MILALQTWALTARPLKRATEKQSGKLALETKDLDENLPGTWQGQSITLSWASSVQQKSQECPPISILQGWWGRSFRGGKVWSRWNRSHEVTRVNTRRYLGLETNLLSLLLNLEAMRSTFRIPYLWQRSCNTTRWGDHSPESTHQQLSKSAWQFSINVKCTEDKTGMQNSAQDRLRIASLWATKCLLPPWWLM